MHSYSYYSRTLLIEFLQKTILINFGKFREPFIYGYFPLINKNKLLVLFNTKNGLLQAFIKYENRNKNDLLITSIKVINNNSIETFANNIDKFIDENNFKKGSIKIVDYGKMDFSFKL